MPHPPLLSLSLLFILSLLTPCYSSPSPFPLIVNTWGPPFTAATDAAYLALLSSPHSSTISALDAVQIGCATCEANQCDGTVGYGGSPDEECETTLDAMIMDGSSMKSGAVANLRRVRDAIAVARHVLEYTQHTLLAGDQATQFALQNGFTPSDLSTSSSILKCQAWRANNCQPNYRLNVHPNPSSSCGPYTPVPLSSIKNRNPTHQASHDTLSLIAIHADGTMAAGTTTNGASHKIPGRVGDGPITGSGSYVDGEVGGCGATGDGDIMMRFLPCYQAVESMRRGMSPLEAAEDAVRRIIRKYPDAQTGIVVVNNRGEHAGAASGWTFTYAYRGGSMKQTEVVTIEPLNGTREEL